MGFVIARALCICNKAQELCIDFCPHATPHEPIELDDDFCTSPGECVLPDMEYEDKFKVKCIKVKKRRKNEKT